MYLKGGCPLLFAVQQFKDICRSRTQIRLYGSTESCYCFLAQVNARSMEKGATSTGGIPVSLLE
jgi:hypothetical protein